MFHNLGILEVMVESVLESARNNLRRSLRKALNVEQLSQLPTSSSSTSLHGGEMKFKGPGRVSMPVTGSSPAFRSALWSNMEKLMDQIFNCCAQVKCNKDILKNFVTRIFRFNTCKKCLLKNEILLRMCVSLKKSTKTVTRI